MPFAPDSKLYEGTMARLQWGPIDLPYEFTGPRDETLAARSTAWLGSALNSTPIYVVSGPDAAEFFERTCTNHGFATMKVGSSKHSLICNDRGQMLADGVTMKVKEGEFRTYWMAPVLQFYVDKSDLDVQGVYVSDEFFFQLDGPKSLTILEGVTGKDLHHIKFARNDKATIAAHEVTVHRLGMSGALAYEIHGDMADVEDVYGALREAVLAAGGKLQGFRNYCTVNHTPAGYPNQNIHFLYPFYSSGKDLADFMEKAGGNRALIGSASDDPENAYATPYEVGWGYMVNFNHDFPGKEALLALKDSTARTTVTLVWDADDIAEVFKSQFDGSEHIYEPIEYHNEFCDMSQKFAVHADYVRKDGAKVGVSCGKTYSYYDNRMISLARIDKELAVEGTEVEVEWGYGPYPVKMIRAKVAQFPYYQGEWRNETCDVDKMVPRK